jgi:hypothetical protein
MSLFSYLKLRPCIYHGSPNFASDISSDISSWEIGPLKCIHYVYCLILFYMHLTSSQSDQWWDMSKNNKKSSQKNIGRHFVVLNWIQSHTKWQIITLEVNCQPHHLAAFIWQVGATGEFGSLFGRLWFNIVYNIFRDFHVHLSLSNLCLLKEENTPIAMNTSSFPEIVNFLGVIDCRFWYTVVLQDTAESFVLANPVYIYM